jgi:hypothetical protein
MLIEVIERTQGRLSGHHRLVVVFHAGHGGIERRLQGTQLV